MNGLIPKAVGVLVLCGAFGLIGGFTGTSPAPRVNAAPVPKKTEPEKLVAWSQPLKAETGFAATHGIWTPDGKHILTGGQVPGAKGGEWPGELRVWDADTGKLIHTHHGAISYVTRPTTVAITPDGKTLAVAGYGNTQPRQFTLDLFDWGEEKPRASWKVNKPVSGVRFSSDGKTLFTVDIRGDLTAREVKSGKLLWTTALGNVTWALSNWNDGKELLVADEGGTVLRFDAATGKMLPPLGKFDITPLSLCVTPDEKRVALGGYGGKTPIVIDCKDRTAGEFRSMKFSDPKVQANQVSLSPDCKFLAVACTDGSLKVCAAATGELLAEAKEHRGVLGGVQFSPDGKRLLTVGQDAIKVWIVAELMKPK
jgi:WD40 repeat protein